MRRFLENGYCDIKSILDLKQPFTFVIGGRGTGKTYGALKFALLNNTRIMLMRRTQSQTDLINKPEFSPFKPLETDLHMEINIKSLSKYNSVITRSTDDSEEAADLVIGYTCALSTISNLRGFDSSDIKLLIYDEFIPEKHERPIKNEGVAFLNAYETMNRNRELTGLDPIQVLALANSFDIANPLFMELGLIEVCEKMKQKNNPVYVNPKRGIALIMLDGSRISERKKKTALYKLTENSSYNEMALANDFVYNSTENVKSLHLSGFRLICGVGDIYIYKHKNNKKYYVSQHKDGVADLFGNDDTNIQRFISKYGRQLYNAYMANRITFENLVVKSLFEWYIM